MTLQTFDSLSFMPQMKAAFSNWMKKITLTKYTQTIVDGDVTNTETSIIFQGVLQPLSAEQINLKPEGQRAWAWWQLHAITSVNNLSVNDRIEISSVMYKVMAVKDYSLNNYIEYHIVEDYQA